METFLLKSFSLTPKQFVRLSDKHDECLLKRTTMASYFPVPEDKNAAKSTALSSIELKSIGSRADVERTTVQHQRLPQNDVGIGIEEFFRGKKFLITGATGFLAKVLVEKMLRTMPEVDKIFLLIRAQNKEFAMERLQNEIIDSDLFKCLQRTYGKSYQAFMLSKLTPVVGNVCESDFGLEEGKANVIAKEVDVIVNSAATTTLDERYDVALHNNTQGPAHMMNFAKKCKKLKLCLQVSTVYVNGLGQGGVIMEEPLCNGDSTPRESLKIPRKSIPILDIQGELELVSDLKKTLEYNQVAKKMKELGLERAHMYGWPNTYLFTKAMGEIILHDTKREVPVVIIRPTVVESTYHGSVPGWIEGNRVLDPIIGWYGKGRMPGFVMDPEGVIDVVPADMVANATIAAIAKHGAAEKSEIKVYQIASSVANPLVVGEMTNMFYEHFRSFPLMDSEGRPIRVPKFKHFTCIKEFSSHLWTMSVLRQVLGAGTHDFEANMYRKIHKTSQKIVEQGEQLANIYKPYFSSHGATVRFDNSNAQILLDLMSGEERRKFNFDVRRIDWKDYFINVHIPGLRRNVMKDATMLEEERHELVYSMKV